MSISKLESKIQREILTYLNSLDGCRAIKVHSFNTRGLPDIHVCHKSRYIVLEVKTESGKVTKLQRIQLQKYEEAGAVAEVVRSLDEVKRIIE